MLSRLAHRQTRSVNLLRQITNTTKKHDSVAAQIPIRDATSFKTATSTTATTKSTTFSDVSSGGLSNINEVSDEKTRSDLFFFRMPLTLEVTISKILPAGFGWQTASVVAENAGFGATDIGFFAITGLGDAMGVGFGHALYYFIKSKIYDSSIDNTEQVHTALLLSTATFASGFCWQPIVNLLQAAGLGFGGTALGTTAVCGFAFYTGMRLGRNLYAKHLKVEKATYQNLKHDAFLSLSIGGATGAFVGTDTSFATGNFLEPVVGIPEGMEPLQASATAGMSTALGFTTFQTIQNMLAPRGKTWLCAGRKTASQ